jgi:hypothetical protein
MAETGQRGRNVLAPLLERFDGLDELELLARAGRALDHCDASVRQAEA